MNTHTDTGWWLVWMLYGALAVIIVEGFITHRRRHRKPKFTSPKRCKHDRLRFHTKRVVADPVMIAVCLDCGTTNIEVPLPNVHRDEQVNVLSDVMQSRGYDQDPIDTVRWTRA